MKAFSLGLLGIFFAPSVLGSALLLINYSDGGDGEYSATFGTNPAGTPISCSNPATFSSCSIATLDGAGCSVDGYSGYISNYDSGGCHSAYEVTRGTITTPSGEVVEVDTDSRCQKYNCCSAAGGLGGAGSNGWQCDV